MKIWRENSNSNLPETNVSRGTAERGALLPQLQAGMMRRASIAGPPPRADDATVTDFAGLSFLAGTPTATMRRGARASMPLFQQAGATTTTTTTTAATSKARKTGAEGRRTLDVGELSAILGSARKENESENAEADADADVDAEKGTPAMVGGFFFTGGSGSSKSSARKPTTPPLEGEENDPSTPVASSLANTTATITSQAGPTSILRTRGANAPRTDAATAASRRKSAMRVGFGVSEGVLFQKDDPVEGTMTPFVEPIKFSRAKAGTGGSGVPSDAATLANDALLQQFDETEPPKMLGTPSETRRQQKSKRRSSGVGAHGAGASRRSSLTHDQMRELFGTPSDNEDDEATMAPPQLASLASLGPRRRVSALGVGDEGDSPTLAAPALRDVVGGTRAGGGRRSSMGMGMGVGDGDNDDDATMAAPQLHDVLRGASSSRRRSSTAGLGGENGNDDDDDDATMQLPDLAQLLANVPEPTTTTTVMAFRTAEDVAAQLASPTMAAPQLADALNIPRNGSGSARRRRSSIATSANDADDDNDPTMAAPTLASLAVLGSRRRQSLASQSAGFEESPTMAAPALAAALRRTSSAASSSSSSSSGESAPASSTKRSTRGRVATPGPPRAAAANIAATSGPTGSGGSRRSLRAAFSSSGGDTPVPAQRGSSSKRKAALAPRGDAAGSPTLDAPALEDLMRLGATPRAPTNTTTSTTTTTMARSPTLDALDLRTLLTQASSAAPKPTPTSATSASSAPKRTKIPTIGEAMDELLPPKPLTEAEYTAAAVRRRVGATDVTTSTEEELMGIATAAISTRVFDFTWTELEKVVTERSAPSDVDVLRMPVTDDDGATPRTAMDAARVMASVALQRAQAELNEWLVKVEESRRASLEKTATRVGKDVAALDAVVAATAELRQTAATCEAELVRSEAERAAAHRRAAQAREAEEEIASLKRKLSEARGAVGEAEIRLKRARVELQETRAKADAANVLDAEERELARTMALVRLQERLFSWRLENIASDGLTLTFPCGTRWDVGVSDRGRARILSVKGGDDGSETLALSECVAAAQSRGDVTLPELVLMAEEALSKARRAL